MAARGVRGGDRRRTHVVLLTSAALIAALGFAQPALAEDGSAAPAADATAAAAANTESTPAADPTASDTGSTEPTTTDPEPAPQSTEPSPSAESEPTEPAPTEEPPGPVVTMEPEPAVIESCTATSGAEGALAGTCETAEPGATAEPSQAACDPNATDGAGAPSTCSESQQAEPAPSAATAPTVAAAPTAPPAAPAATVVLVVSLAPEQPAVAPADAAAAAGLEDPVQASVEEPWATIAPAPAVELISAAPRVAELAEADQSEGGVAGILAVRKAVPLLGTTPLTYLPTVNGVIATGTIVQGARASPRERDGHRAVAAKAEEQRAPAAGPSPTGPLENLGLGASGGSAGGVAGAASLRYFALASTPLRFNFPSTFAHAPLPSSVPEGALEDAPTTRPG